MLKDTVDTTVGVFGVLHSYMSNSYGLINAVYTALVL